jgi:hypothetical protein
MAILFTTKVDLGMDERQVSCKFEPGLWLEAKGRKRWLKLTNI